ncbi:MAG TPA: hypothetical protein VIF82_09165 [Burkholderiaceae bacterium]|jgi:hypothetical protein
MKIFELASAILISIGSAGILLFGLSSWLGKVWASRILEKERNELSILKEQFLKEHSEKVLTYKSVIDIVSKILADFDKWQMGDLSLEKGKEAFHSFNEQRIKAYGYLCMVASQSIMDTHDALIENILCVANGNAKYDWDEIRKLALAFINEIRKDIAIDKTSISYKGNR